MFKDLRDFIELLDRKGELKYIEGADWNLELGTITELAATKITGKPALLFDKVKGYPAGYQIAANLFQTDKRVALVLGLPTELKRHEMSKVWAEKIKTYKPLPPVFVPSGPVKENVLTGDDIDVFKFPVPKWHELDGGRYIGTGTVVIQKDPETGYINLGTYRFQCIGKDRLLSMVQGARDGSVIRQRYFERGENCPAVVCCGQEPALYAMTHYQRIPFGVTELNYAGWLRGTPVELVKGETVDLPIPATAEIAIEGEYVHPDRIPPEPEGPFGEVTGYYASGHTSMPVFQIKAILHRNNPIILGDPPLKPPGVDGIGMQLMKQADVWEFLSNQLPDVRGVSFIPAAVGVVGGIMVIALKQRYPGHARQAAMLAANYVGTTWGGRFTIVVDEDVDPSDIDDVLWAVATRCDPETQLDVIRGLWDNLMTPSIPQEKRQVGDITSAKVIILACRPYHWKEKYAKVIAASPQYADEILKKWQKQLNMTT